MDGAEVVLISLGIKVMGIPRFGGQQAEHSGQHA
jgi:hypothetical protein